VPPQPQTYKKQNAKNITSKHIELFYITRFEQELLAGIIIICESAQFFKCIAIIKSSFTAWTNMRSDKTEIDSLCGLCSFWEIPRWSKIALTGEVARRARKISPKANTMFLESSLVLKFEWSIRLQWSVRHHLSIFSGFRDASPLLTPVWPDSTPAGRAEQHPYYYDSDIHYFQPAKRVIFIFDRNVVWNDLFANPAHSPFR